MNEPNNKNEEHNDFVFNSIEFGNFLNQELPSKLFVDSPSCATPPEMESLFLSKDDPLPKFEDASIFQSKDMFSKLFQSQDTDIQQIYEQFRTTKSSVDDESMEEPDKKMAPFPLSKSFDPGSSRNREGQPPPPAEVFSSKDWITMNTLGEHVDISFSSSSDFFSAMSDMEAQVATETLLSPSPPPMAAVGRTSNKKTDWDSLFQSQLAPEIPAATAMPEETLSSPTPAVASLPSAVLTTTKPAPQPAAVPSQPAAAEPNTPVAAPATAPKRKRKRKPRAKVVPETKEYVTPTDMDVLLGRGGRSNNHPGNKRYREEVSNLRSWYMGTNDKDEKTDLSQCLVDYIHSYNGRFLEKDETGWYMVPNIVARRKASQALREDNDADKRKAKRDRFLKKREAMLQQDQQRTKTG